MKKLFTTALWVCCLLPTISWSAERFYELNIDTKMVNYTGNPVEAMVINQSLPGPRLEFMVGDAAVIKVNNYLDSAASIHWHGLLLPQDQDGVPYLTYFPIAAGESFTYRFPITHAGTYWYHSHTRIDEQRGQYGSIVIHPKDKKPLDYHYDEVVQLSDWTDEDPIQVLANLKKSEHWYALKKDSVISIKGYIEQGRFKAWLQNRWQRMEGMDVSDVAYDAFLANGKKALQLFPEAKAGEKVRLRFINSGASSYFSIEQSDAPFTVIAADGIDVQPVTVEKFLMGMAETYDVIVTIPESGALEINANNIDGSGKAKIMIGSGAAKPAPEPVKPDLYQAMNHAAHQGHNMMAEKENKHHQHAHHEKSKATELDYTLLKTREPIHNKGPLREVQLDLTGDMETYNWSFNNTPLSAADKILVKRGEVVRFVFNNTTMMRHPLHLHGHFFKVLSGNGDYDVLKHTVDVPPMETVTIEFFADAEKDWLFHCHNLYHAKTGMARVVRYEDYQGNPAFDKAKMMAANKGQLIMDTDWYQRTDIHLYSNHLEAEFTTSNSRYAVELEAAREDWEETEVEAYALYRHHRWLQSFVGAEYERDSEENSSESEATLRPALCYALLV